mmetsp:Transcript_2354/g.7139  ORF Transcript_2354/g.7139 Transcript_2354/m.7139 type:complete len:271 (-) Transcript_2354:130-942(-)
MPSLVLRNLLLQRQEPKLELFPLLLQLPDDVFRAAIVDVVKHVLLVRDGRLQSLELLLADPRLLLCRETGRDLILELVLNQLGVCPPPALDLHQRLLAARERRLELLDLLLLPPHPLHRLTQLRFCCTQGCSTRGQLLLQSLPLLFQTLSRYLRRAQRLAPCLDHGCRHVDELTASYSLRLKRFTCLGHLLLIFSFLRCKSRFIFLHNLLSSLFEQFAAVCFLLSCLPFCYFHTSRERFFHDFLHVEIHLFLNPCKLVLFVRFPTKCQEH